MERDALIAGVRAQLYRWVHRHRRRVGLWLGLGLGALDEANANLATLCSESEAQLEQLHPRLSPPISSHAPPPPPPRLPLLFAAPHLRRFRALLDKATPYPAARWLALAALVAGYALRVYLLNGWYIVTYGVAIFVLNLFIGFISPQADQDADGPVLPTKGGSDGEYKPFSRKVPEFTFWFSATRAVFVGYVLTLFDIFNVPVYWPILVVYFLALFVATMRRQIADMVKRRYVPCSWGKKSYSGGGGSGSRGPIFKGAASH